MSNVIEINRVKYVKDDSFKRDHGQGAVRKLKSSKYLHFDFYYYGVRVRLSSGYLNTAEGLEEAQKALDQITQEIQQGAFNFAKRFPFASDEKKKYFSHLEGRDYSPSARDVTVGEYYPKWRKRVWDTFTESKQRDDETRLNYHILPFFGELPFSQITRVKMKEFVGHLISPKVSGRKPQSPQSIRNILIPLREVYYDAVDECGWELPDPFLRLGKSIPKGKKEDVEVFTLAEWMRILEELFWFYRPAAEFSVMTGLRPSELAGLRETDIRDGIIDVRNSIVRKREKEELKTDASQREIDVSPRLHDLIVQQREVKKKQGIESPYLFTTSEGNPFDIDLFRKNSWTSALKRAGVPYRKPYTMRHTFAAWMLLIGKPPLEVVALMGHSSKKMVYETYGKFVKGLEKEKEEIRAYLGI